MKKYIKFFIPFLLCLAMIVSGIVLDGGLVGTLLLVLGVITMYYNSQGKWQSYIFGMIYTIVSIIVYYKNGQFGAVIASVICYEPILIYGLINWKKNQSDNTVIMMSLPKKKAIIAILGIIITGIVSGIALSFISSEKNAFFDAFSQLLNISANLLLMMRFKECWSVWIIGGFVDIVLWSKLFALGGENAHIMLINSFIYLVMNIYGFISWNKISKLQKE